MIFPQTLPQKPCPHIPAPARFPIPLPPARIRTGVRHTVSGCWATSHRTHHNTLPRTVVSCRIPPIPDDLITPLYRRNWAGARQRSALSFLCAGPDGPHRAAFGRMHFPICTVPYAMYKFSFHCLKFRRQLWRFCTLTVHAKSL